MPTSRLFRSAGAADAIDFNAVRAELGVPSSFPPEVVDAARLAASSVRLPDLDRTDLPLVTIDPPGSMDLDQAMHLERHNNGYLVHYAIADVASFVEPGGVIDREAHRRGETLYSPDLATPLHPRELSEGAASLLPDQVRPAVLWSITLDADGKPLEVDVRRARVCSIARLDYDQVRDDQAAGRMHPSIALLPEIGELRRQAALERHAIVLDLPDVVVERAGGGAPDGEVDGGGAGGAASGLPERWTLILRGRNPIEDANAEISLLTGMCAAQMMLDGHVGLLRTLPPAGSRDAADLHRSATALGFSWPPGVPPGDFLTTVDGTTPKGAALLEDAVRLLRGAGYTPFVGEPPAQPGHAGVGAPYAHVTAPLRRLADRYATEICLSLHASAPVPDWVTADLDGLPEIMATSDRHASDLERACAWAVTAFVLSGREGELFAGTVVQLDEERDRATVLLDDPPVRGRAAADGLIEGSAVKVRLTGVDATTRTVQVEPVHE